MMITLPSLSLLLNIMVVVKKKRVIHFFILEDSGLCHCLLSEPSWLRSFRPANVSDYACTSCCSLLSTYCFTFTRLLEAMYQHRLGFITRIFKFHFESKIVNFWKIQTFIIYSIEFSVPLLHVYYAEHGLSPLLPKNSYLILLTMRCSIVKWRVPYSPRTKER